MASAAEEDSSAQSRLVSWVAAIEMAREYPFTGVGLGCFTMDYHSYAQTLRTPSSPTVVLPDPGYGWNPGRAPLVAIVIRTWQVLV